MSLDDDDLQVLRVKAGDRLGFPVNFHVKGTGEPLPGLDGNEWLCQVRASPADEPIAVFDIDDTNAAPDADPPSQLIFRMEPADSALLTRLYYVDLQDVTNEVTRLSFIIGPSADVSFPDA